MRGSGGAAPDAVPAERLLAGLALVPIPAGFALHALAGLLGGGTAQAATGVAGAAVDPVGATAQFLQLLGKPAVAAAAGLTLVAGGAYVVHDHQNPPRPPRAASPFPSLSPSPEATAPTEPAGSPTPSRKPKPKPKPKKEAKSKSPTARYGSVVDKAEPAPDPSARPGPLPRRPEPGLTSSAGPKAVMVHRDDTVTLRGRGYALVRWQILPNQRAGALVMPT
ncbi:hypothetical protein ABZ837_41165 [Streptomyces sp. NPDC047197]|uniref:hypothetical protein n=1 Tax=Streptomyces sp. NPDC047197 TaxID=3155477 RepID=UPI0033C36209